jgi:dipeptidyl aminopeptidase/acylaminoacyl peptidase
VRWILQSASLALILSGSSAVAAEAPVARIPVSKFTFSPSLEKPVLSPDGRLIAALRVIDDKTTLLITDSDHPDAPAKAIPVGKATISDMKWAGGKRLLLQVRLMENNGERKVPILRLASIDIDSGAVQLLDAKSQGIIAGNLLYVDPTGTWALVASQNDLESYPSVKRVDLATGDSKTVEQAHNEIWNWYADDNGIVRAGVAYDGPHYKVWYRDNAGEELHEVKGKLQTNDDSTVDRLIFHGGNTWVLTNARTGRFGLYKYDVKTGAIGTAIFEHPEVDVDNVVFNAATGDLNGVKYQDDRAQIYWLDASMKSLQSALDAAVPDATNLPIGWSQDGRRVLVQSTSGAEPGRYFVLDRAAHQMHEVAEQYPDLDSDQLAPVKPVRYQTRDGLTLRAYLTMPRGREAKALPLIVLPHGGPFARDDGAYDPVVQFLANRGYVVLQPEFRGTTGFGKDFVAKGYGEVGRKMQDDLDDGVDWLAKLGQIDPKRVCIVGLSYGGYAAMWGAIRNPERYRCAASWAGPTDMPAMMHYDRDQLSAPRYFRAWRKQFATDEELKAVSPLHFAAHFKVPIFIAQGEEDTTVPPGQSHKMVDALTHARANVTSVFYKQSKHRFGSSKDFQDWLSHLEAFLDKYNPA